MYKLGVDKAAAPRWAKMMAAGKLSPEATAVLKKMKGLRPRRIGTTPLAEGTEKIVHKGFAGDDVGPAVIKRIKQEIMPGTTKAYLNAASKHPDVFNAPIAIHGDKGGWTERALQEKPDIINEMLAKLKSKGQERFVHPIFGDGTWFSRNPTAVIGGKAVHDIHSGNVMYDPVSDSPKIIDALVASPRVKARRAIHRHGSKALAAATVGLPAIAGATLIDTDAEVPRIDDTQMSESQKRIAKRGVGGAFGASIGAVLAAETRRLRSRISEFLARKVAPVTYKGF